MVPKVICDFFILQRLPLVWGNLYVLLFTATSYVFMAWMIQALCKDCVFSFWDSDNNAGFTFNDPSLIYSWIGLIIINASYFCSFFLFLWFIRWRDQWGKKVQRRKFKDMRVTDDVEGWQVYDETVEHWKHYQDRVAEEQARGWRSTVERNSGKLLRNRDSMDEPKNNAAEELEVSVPEDEEEESSVQTAKQWWQAWLVDTGVSFGRRRPAMEAAISQDDESTSPTSTSENYVSPTSSFGSVVKKTEIDASGPKRSRLPAIARGVLATRILERGDRDSMTDSPASERFVTAPRAPQFLVDESRSIKSSVPISEGTFERSASRLSNSGQREESAPPLLVPAPREEKEDSEGDFESGWPSMSSSVASEAYRDFFPTMKSVKVAEGFPPVPPPLEVPQTSIWSRFARLFLSDDPTPSLELADNPLELATEPKYVRTEEFFDPFEEAPRRFVEGASSTMRKATTWFRGLPEN